MNEADAAALVSLAWWWMGQATVTAVRRSVRTLGGYGLALEYDLQLYNRRGNSLVLLGGDPLQELERAGDILHASAPATVPKSADVGIDFSVGEAGRRHAEKLQAFFMENWDDRMRAKAHHSSASHDAIFHRKLAEAGLIYSSWPAEYGGRKASTAEDAAAALVFEKWNYTSHIIVVCNLVGKIVMRHASADAKAEIIPRIKAGEAVCSLGFSEPASGSDVFAAKTAAVRDGDDWIINGQKMFTTGGHFADYVLLLTRTSSAGPKHQGLTFFIVPTKLKGYEAQPVKTYMDERTNVTFYSDLRIPDKYRIGKTDEGAAVMADALTLEHGGGNYFSGQARMMRNAIAWAEAKDASGVRPLDNKSIRARLAKVRARFEVAACFAARDSWAADVGHMDRSWGPMAKLFISESYLASTWEILEMAGPSGVLTGTDPLGTVELDHRRAYGTTIYGGTSEIHRSIIAEQALGLPKSRS
jgi:alkylation response protein AidB-like acyl-CoA dehydrogenase